MIAARLGALAVPLAIAPLLLFPKCLAFDETTPRDAAPADVSPVPGPAPAVACDRPGVARLRVRDYAFGIQCGCREASGRTCTIPAGTTVIWTFQDSDTHNVTVDELGASDDRLTGAHEVVFPAVGTFDYGCSIHAGIMSGYRIEVVE